MIQAEIKQSQIDYYKNVSRFRGHFGVDATKEGISFVMQNIAKAFDHAALVRQGQKNSYVFEGKLTNLKKEPSLDKTVFVQDQIVLTREDIVKNSEDAIKYLLDPKKTALYDFYGYSEKTPDGKTDIHILELAELRNGDRIKKAFRESVKILGAVINKDLSWLEDHFIYRTLKELRVMVMLGQLQLNQDQFQTLEELIQTY